MNWKALAALVLLPVLAQWPSAAVGQTGGHSAASAQTARPASANAAPQNPGSTPGRTDCEAGPCDYQPSHITIATPAPAPAPSSLLDQIKWAAILVLVILGYAGIMMALSLLRKIERQTRFAETAAQAAAESAQAAMLQAQAIVRSERPWILITVEPSRSVENGFTVLATNRGRSPARIVSTVDQITSAIDQNHLPDTPQYRDAEPSAAPDSVILLPGESTGIRSFSRDDVKGFCVNEEKLKRVEKWEELILLYGKVIYRDLISAGDEQVHESSWCCWYIHGRQKSGMVLAGPPAYNRHN